MVWHVFFARVFCKVLYVAERFYMFCAFVFVFAQIFISSMSQIMPSLYPDQPGQHVGQTSDLEESDRHSTLVRHTGFLLISFSVTEDRVKISSSLKAPCHESFLLIQYIIYVVNMTGTHLLNFYYLIF